jgi:type 1 glutamine amidotransferase
MKAALVLLAICVLLVNSSFADDNAKPLRVCLVSGSLEYDSDASLGKLQKHMEKRYLVECSRAFIKTESDLPGLENLDKCEVMLLFTRRLKITGEQLERVKKYCLAGKPIVGIRTASHAFQNWLDLDKEVLGGNYLGHYKEGPLCEVTLADSAKSHPILKGVQPYQSAGSLYKNTGLAKDVNILLTGSIPEHSEPIAWTRNYKGARIFYTSLGQQKDFDDPNFVTLITNALYWTAQREAVVRKMP